MREDLLPEVDTDDGSEREERILVRSGDSLKLLSSGVDSQPGPAGSLDTESGSVDGLLETFESTKVSLDGFEEGSRGGRS